MKRAMFKRLREYLFRCGACLLLIATALLLAGCGADAIKGYYAIQVNPPPADASAEKQQANMVFGFEKLALNEDHTFRLGFLRGTWKRSGATLTLEPTAKPDPNQFYSQTTMADALSILLNPTDFTVSSDEKKLTAVNAAKGPVVFTKVGDGLN